MKEIHLDGARMLDQAATHAYLKQELGLPAHYGENLDALWDCLSTDFAGKKITIDRTDLITAQLGDYGASLLQLFRDAAAENPHIEVHMN